MSRVLIEDAVREWSTVLGEAFVVSESGARRKAETATFQTSQKIPVILRPENRDQVREAVRIANDHGFAIYPISSGKNWGYGSSVPVESGCALLDLSRMNRITGFDE